MHSSFSWGLWSWAALQSGPTRAQTARQTCSSSAAVRPAEHDLRLTWSFSRFTAKLELPATLLSSE